MQDTCSLRIEVHAPLLPQPRLCAHFRKASASPRPLLRAVLMNTRQRFRAAIPFNREGQVLPSPRLHSCLDPIPAALSQRTQPRPAFSYNAALHNTKSAQKDSARFLGPYYFRKRRGGVQSL